MDEQRVVIHEGSPEFWAAECRVVFMPDGVKSCWRHDSQWRFRHPSCVAVEIHAQYPPRPAGSHGRGGHGPRVERARAKRIGPGLHK